MYRRAGKVALLTIALCCAWIGGNKLTHKLSFYITDTKAKLMCKKFELCALEDEPNRWYLAPQPVLWAHAGGGQLAVYTNSKEAIDDSISKGYSVIEVDVSLTKDGVPVLSHAFCPSGIHWPHEPPTYKEFVSAKIVGRWTPLSLKECLENYADKIVISIDPLSIIVDPLARDFDLVDYIERNTTLTQRENLMFQVYKLEELPSLHKRNVFGSLHFETYFYRQFLNANGAEQLSRILTATGVRSVSFGEQPITDDIRDAVRVFNSHNIRVSVASVNTPERYWAWRDVGVFCFDSDLLSPEMEVLHSKQ